MNDLLWHLDNHLHIYIIAGIIIRNVLYFNIVTENIRYITSDNNFLCVSFSNWEKEQDDK